MISKTSADASLAMCAERLFNAEITRRAIAPLTDANPELTIAEAYGIQQVNIARRLASGAAISGHKIGLTAAAMRKLFGVDVPDYGHILDCMMHDSAEPLDLGELIDPQIEVEPAFVLRSALHGPSVTARQVLAATDYLCVCLEVIDSRIAEWRIKLQDTVADNGSSARVVVGSTRVRPCDVDIGALDAELELGGTIVERGNTREILGHPAEAIAWLANKLSEFGLGLEAGQIVLPGTCTRSRRVGAHANVLGRIASLGEVALALTGRPAFAESHG